jgi:hypothetical protein
MTQKRPPEVWETLLNSSNLISDLDATYCDTFLRDFTRHFDRNPSAVELIEGVHTTARAYLAGRQQKAVDKDQFLQRTGQHLIGVGLAARRLDYALRQVSKSGVAADILNENLKKTLAEQGQHGWTATRSAKNQIGPGNPLKYLIDTAQALEQAAGGILALPEEYDEERDAKARALQFAEDFNTGRKSKPDRLPANHALEQAARAFRPTWERFSSLLYARGRYHHDLGRYDSKPAFALFQIIRKLDSTTAESLVGTAIENSRNLPKVD